MVRKESHSRQRWLFRIFGLTPKPIAHQLEDIGLWNGNMAINTKQKTQENKRGKYTKYKKKKKIQY